MSQHLILIPTALEGAQLDIALYGGTYRVAGTVAGTQVFWFDLSPTSAAPFDEVVERRCPGRMPA
ncbi:hypothetical protein [Deinococcus sp. Leaf326]|uniref:hypothetical protein n=1 Tax=Deinococcus sp. Leaf326 TaxID=1736338 RepID=UPI0006FDE53B|nr:hypothetical protein [Deinococcus sp. Leaf326]KQR18736.1 hypothetical protein ASF71_20175 [Deinococcus sp. Leaf326]